MSNPDPVTDPGGEPGVEPGTESSAGRGQPTAEVQESNPNAAGPLGLSGGMGVSSERTGPLGDDPAVAGVQGTGSHGTAAEGTDGVSDTSRADVPDAPGPEMDRTVGEANTAEAPAHESDPLRNPGHSHGS